MKIKKQVKIVATILVFSIIIGLCSYAEKTFGYFKKGNSSQYSISNCIMTDDSNLKDKNIIFLGSSVTYGFCSHGESFVDFLEAEYGVNSIKEAKSGTTLVDDSDDSYISRMKTIDTKKADAFVCQLSTNDATQNKPLGEVSDSFDSESFDTSTVAGAIEYVIAFAQDKWDCKVIFFTNPQYDSDNYKSMVNLLLKIQKKWNIGVIDLWNNEEVNSISSNQQKLYMSDKIHPTRAGYKELWTPIFKDYLENNI